MGKAITDSERETILGLLSQGHSHNEVARRTGKSQAAVSDLARKHSIEPVNQMPKAQAAAREYNKLERANLLNLAFDRVKALITRDDTTARDMKDLVTALAILVDKRRLEDGEAGKISEQRTSSDRLDLGKEFRKLDEELAEELKRKEERNEP